MRVVDQMRQDMLPKGSPGGKDPVMGSSSAAGWVGARQVISSPPIISHLGY